MSVVGDRVTVSRSAGVFKMTRQGLAPTSPVVYVRASPRRTCWRLSIVAGAVLFRLRQGKSRFGGEQRQLLARELLASAAGLRCQVTAATNVRYGLTVRSRPLTFLPRQRNLWVTDTVEWCRERSARVAGGCGAGGASAFFVASCVSNQFELPGKPFAVREDLRRKPDFIVGRFSENGVVAGRQTHLLTFALPSGAFLRFTLTCPGNHSATLHRAIGVRLESKARSPRCQREELVRRFWE